MPQDQLKTIATRNQVYLERYKAGELTKFEQFLVTMANDVNSILARDDITDFTRSRMETLISQVGVMMGRSFDEYHKVWKAGIDELSMYQAGFEARALESVVDGVVFAIPSDSQIMAAIYATPIGVIKGASGGSLLEPFFAGMTQSEIERVQGAIRLGYAEGQTTAQIMQRVKGTKAAGYTDGLWDTTKRNVSAVVRTSLQHAASYARDSVWQENKSVIKGVEWVSTLDSRTSPQCRSLDGQVFPLDKGPRPPAHINACLKGTKITTNRGLVNIEDVCVGDYVKTHTGSFKRVYIVMAREHKGNARDLINNFGSRVSLTNEHPILTLRKGWIESGQVETGDIFFHDSKQFNGLDVAGESALIPQRVLIDSHNIKTNVTEELVSYSIFSRSTGVSASVQLNNCIPNDKIRVICKYPVLGRVFNINTIKDRCKKLFMFRWFGFKNKREGFPSFYDSLFTKRWIEFFHSYGRPLALFRMQSWIFNRPMIVAAWIITIFNIVADGLLSILRFNPIRFTEFSNSVVGKVVFPLNSSKTFSIAPMLYRNDFSNINTHDNLPLWKAATCSDIVEYHYSGMVYNLAVEDDETYIANGIVVHNCRSTTTAALKGKYAGLMDDMERSSRDPATGKVKYVSADETYYSWLKKQPAAFQDSVIGTTRGKLMRNGGLSSERFAELQLGKTFEPLTLEQMRKLEPLAFQRAGL